ncbi:MAG: hypothetical protein ACOCSN_06915 [Halanaeroarchaeum sp.]
MQDDRTREGRQADLGRYGTESTEGGASRADDSGSEEPIVVEVKPSARERNAAADRLASERGTVHEYPSREAAAERAESLSESGDTRVALQRVAPQDDTPADAYLVAQPRRHVETPHDPDARTLVFDASGNQYGAIGEALLTTPGTNPPVLTHYVREDLDVEDEIRVETDTGRTTTREIDDDGRRSATWTADLVATAHRVATGAPIREYWCEIKAGGGSFERDQRAVMRAKAADPDVTVLKIRVDLDPLPDRYGVRIDEVSD